MIRTACLSAALALSLAGCAKTTAEPDETVPPAASVAGGDETPVQPAAAIPDPHEVSVADLPRAISVDSDTVKADITFAEPIFGYAPAMAMDVVEDARIRLAATQEDAAAYKEADPDYFRPYVLRIDWRLTGAGGGLAGLEGFQYADTGGAHGNYFTDGRIYDTLTGDQLRLKDLFEDPAAANAALEGPVFRALETEKALRTGDTSNLDMLLGEAKDAIGGDILGVDASLVASVEAGKIGGLALHFAPYDIGSYAEGAYHVTIPQEAFAALLKPHYAGAFGGEPAPLKRPDDPV